jgi:hypothetical protein
MLAEVRDCLCGIPFEFHPRVYTPKLVASLFSLQQQFSIPLHQLANVGHFMRPKPSAKL